MQDLRELEDFAATEAALNKALEGAASVVRSSAVVRLPADAGAWLATGLHVLAGQEVTLLSRGVLWLSREHGMGVQGKLALWYRLGDGPIAKALGATTTFVADKDGPLWLINHLAGQWDDVEGNFDPSYQAGGGALSVGAVIWAASARAGLEKLALRDGTGLASDELERLDAARPAPAGWRPLWRVGETSIFCDAPQNGGPARILCRCAEDAGIIKYALDLPLGEATRLAWAWRVDELPSPVAEDQAPTHDYLSIAVEFENGQDLTYIWSSVLAPETSFRCPLPWWDKRETHVVVRSGQEELGRWLEEERSVLADYRRAVGGPDPARIVGVWLIAVSAFQRRRGSCDYARIRLEGGGADVLIGPR